MVWGIRAVRRAVNQWRINTAAHEAQLCLRDARVAHENYHAQMRLLAVLHGRRLDLKGARAPAASSTRRRAEPVPVLLCVPGRMVRQHGIEPTTPWPRP